MLASMALVQTAFEALVGIQTEIVIFVVALCTHKMLFHSAGAKTGPRKVRRLSSPTEGQLSGAGRTVQCPQSPGTAALTRLAKQLLRQGADQELMTRKLEGELKAGSPESASRALEGMLQNIGRAANAEIIAAVREVVRERGLVPSARLAELLLRSCLGLRLRAEFTEVLADVEASMGITPGIAVQALKASLAASDLEATLRYLRCLAPQMKQDQNATALPSVAPKQLMQQLVHLAAEKAAMPMLLQELRNCGLFTASTLEAVLAECAERGDLALSEQAEVFARSQGLGLTDAAYAALVRSAGSAEGALRLFAEAAEQGLVGKSLVLAAVESAASRGDAALAEAASQHFRACPSPELAVAVLRLYFDGPLAGENADISVLQLYSACMTGLDVLADARTGQKVAEAALRCHRPDVLAQLLRATPDVPRQVALLKSFSSERRLLEATEVFRACPAKTVSLYNALLGACVECQDLEAAEQVMAEALAAGMADVVTYNTMIKTHLQRGDLQRARAAIEAMRAAGGSLAPNCVTFNELIDATIRTSSEGAWLLVDEMRASGLQPNGVTCSILLKSVQHSANAREVERAMAAVDDMDGAMDEVLLSSACEACIRIGRADALRRLLQRHRGERRVQASSAHTYGSLVRAYGFLKDVGGAWAEWAEMRRQCIAPTSITIGCMVEALVSNGDPEAGHELIRELSGDEQTRALLNAVIYCSVLKGFSRQKRFDRVWAVYDEMLEQQLQFSVVTYNALIDACARSCQMARVPGFLEDMARQSIAANIVTYSTIIKGYCQEGWLDRAFELLEAMKQSGEFRPDEITYNTLIDGCAQRGLYARGMRLLDEMQEAGVAPSTFTLSVLVKLANRGRKPEKAFELCDVLSRKYRLRLNVHVYNNLVHACTAAGDAQRAIRVFAQMLREKVLPDARTYSLLLRGSLSAGEAQDAAGLLRAAVGLRSAHPQLAAFPASTLQLHRGLPAELLSEVLEGIAGRCGEERLAMQLLKDLRALQGLKLDPKLPLSLPSKAVGTRGGS